MSETIEFGDFQTPRSLANKVIELLSVIYPKPENIVEPTAGLGTFLASAYQKWGGDCHYQGYEINPKYAEAASKTLSQSGICIAQQDFFSLDWQETLTNLASKRVLLLGNPPWVTNSALGSLGSTNLPAKANFQGLRGLDAMTGKSNFDISEWMLIRLLEALPKNGAMAMLCKTATARKVLRHFWQKQEGWSDCRMFRIDAKAEFDVSVDACLLFVSGEKSRKETSATLYNSLELDTETGKFGYIDGQLVSDIASYIELKRLDGGSNLTWRSGLKHDASKVMELTKTNVGYLNGFGEKISLESKFVYPLLKSSDLGNGRVIPRKFVIVPQKTSGENTASIKETAPLTWDYLCSHGSQLDGRKAPFTKTDPALPSLALASTSSHHGRSRYQVFIKR